MKTAALAFIVATSPIGFPQAAEPSFTPVQVGKSGPLLFLVHPEDEAGKSVSGGGSRKEVLYLYDPSFHKSPQQLWQGQNPRPKPIARIEPNLVVMDYRDDVYLLRLSSGFVSPILPGEEQTEVVRVEGSNVLFLKRTVPYTPSGYKLASRGEPPVTVIKEYYRPRDYLYHFEPSAPAPVLLADVQLERVLTVDSNAVWVITAGSNRKLCRISMQGRVDEIIAVDDHWVAPEISLTFSPGGKFVALAALHDQHAFHHERELMVVHVEQKRVIYSRERIPVSKLDQLGGNPPYLPVRWLDESILSLDFFMQTQVDVEKGTRLTDAEAAKLAGRYGTPVEPERKRRLFFDHEFGRLYFSGEKQPIAEVLDHRKVQVTNLAISPKGDWAAFVSPKDNNAYIVDGRNKRRSLLLSGWSYDLTWIP